MTAARLVAIAAGTLAALLGAGVAEVSAQATSQRPFRGIFGGSNPNAGEGGLTLYASLMHAYDDDLTGRSSNAASARTQTSVGGQYSSGSVELSFTKPGDRFGFSATGKSQGAYYPEFPEVSGFSHFGTASMDLSVGRLSASVAQSAGYSPYFSFALVPIVLEPGEPIPIDPVVDVNVIRRDSRYYQTRASISQGLTERTTISATVGYRKGSFAGGQGDLTHRSGSLRISRKFTRYLALSAGYGIQQGRYSEPKSRTTETRDISIGTDYDRPLSRTRRTFLSLSSGAAQIEDQRGQSFRVTGAAGLRHEIGRSWTANVNYNRGVRYLEGFPEPFLSDGVRAGLHGFVSRRVDLSFNGGYSTGVIGVRTDGSGYRNYFSTAVVRFALTQLLALSSEYLYYHYAFDRDPEITGLPREVERHGVRVSLGLWLPLLR